MPIRFILNDRELETAAHPATTLLDCIRGEARLTGTKIGCREGDCGACTSLIGGLEDGVLRYRPMTSCLTPLGNAAGKHVVTVEGLNPPSGLSAVQAAIVEEGGTQCGFCTPGFVVSLTGFCMDNTPPTTEAARTAMDGNICRCTGYKSIERAAARVADQLSSRPDSDRLAWLVDKGFLPTYFRDIPAWLATLAPSSASPAKADAPFLGGGTDLLVQRPDAMPELDPALVYDRPELRGIRIEDGHCVIGAGTTAEALRRDPLLNRWFPSLDRGLRLLGSTPIRHMATIGGNLVNASPIGDMTIMFLALDAELTLRGPDGARRLPLRRFYQGYKTLDKREDELLVSLRFPVPNENTRFHFEKVSKRTYLDIASVNTAICLEIRDGRIDHAGLAAGGVAPVPLFLAQTSAWLKGRAVDPDTARAAAARAMSEISPIGDVRGSAEYKRLLLRQLIQAHFLTLFPDLVPAEAIA